jgi:hypothetical protein
MSSSKKTQNSIDDKNDKSFKSISTYDDIIYLWWFLDYWWYGHNTDPGLDPADTSPHKGVPLLWKRIYSNPKKK